MKRSKERMKTVRVPMKVSLIWSGGGDADHNCRNYDNEIPTHHARK